MGLDEEAMPHINMANIACGFHAGDADVMANTPFSSWQNSIRYKLALILATQINKVLADDLWR